MRDMQELVRQLVKMGLIRLDKVQAAPTISD